MRAKQRILGFVAAFSFAGLLLSGLATPVHAATEQKLSYTAFTGEEEEDLAVNIRRIDVDGSNDTPLTNGGPGEYAGYLSKTIWSPDGSKVVYTVFNFAANTVDIHIMDADGSDDVNLTNSPGDTFNGFFGISWRGDKIVYTQQDGSGLVIRRMNVDGSNNIALTSSNNDVCPNWVDDNTIAFASLRDGNTEVYTMNADGSNQTNITNNAQHDGLSSQFCNLEVSPDASKLAFYSTRAQPGTGSDIFTMNIDGSEVTRITTTGFNRVPRWSHDGSTLAFVSTRAGGNQIFTVPATGGTETQLTDEGTANGFSSGESGNQSLEWSPDDSKLAFMSNRVDNIPMIFLMDADGSNQTQLTPEGQQSIYPNWIPAGDNDPEEGDQDLNGDDIPDSEQPNVGGYTSPITGKTVAIDVGSGCELTVDDLTRESSMSAQDPDYTYPHGLFDFAGDCGSPGFTTTVRLYYYDAAPGGFVFRKFNPNHQRYSTVETAQLSQTTIDGHQVTVVTYNITDGGELDTDQAVNGEFADPAGVAVAGGTLASTGSSYMRFYALAFALLGIGIAMISRILASKQQF